MASPNRICSIDDCEKPVNSRGWCKMHYRRWQRHGSPNVTLNPTMGWSVESRFWAKVNKCGAVSEYRPDLGRCWLWTASLNAYGYGQFSPAHGKPVRSHRLSYELIVGPIPEELTLDHLCRVRHCVNPAHLEPVTMGVNILRGDTISARYALRTHCKKGHPFTRDRKGHRWCHICRLEYRRTVEYPRYRERIKQRPRKEEA